MDKKKILALVVINMLKTIFGNHVYMFRGNIYLQTDSGPIGLRFTGSIARLVLIYFDKMFISIATKCNIKVVLYKRFVDDINSCCSKVEYGMKYDDSTKSLSFCQEQYKTDVMSQMSVHTKTFQTLKLIANSITRMINWEIDLPENYTDNMIPVLDLKVGLVSSDRQAPIKHYYYRKPMSSQLVLTGTSSMPAKVKRSILINEGLRRIRNNCLSGSFLRNIETLRDFNIAMSVSGHCERFRLEVTDKVIQKYQFQLDNHENGSTPFYRNKFERAEFKEKHKLRYKTKSGWHERFGFRAVLNVPPTPQSKLANIIKNVLNSTPAPRGYKIMVRETNGISLRNKICNFTNPWPKVSCDRQKCLPCNNSSDQVNSNSNNIDCWTAGVMYRINCNLCKQQGIIAQYEGESSRSSYTRGAQHLKDLEGRKAGTPLGDHVNQFHPGTSIGMETVTMKCTGRYQQPTQRLTSEGISIEKLIKLQKSEGREKIIIMNGKTNYYQPSLISQHSSKLSLQ